MFTFFRKSESENVTSKVKIHWREHESVALCAKLQHQIDTASSLIEKPGKLTKLEKVRRSLLLMRWLSAA